jgi:hypothetical protein
MPTQRAVVRTEDLEAALDFLEGLLLISETLATPEHSHGAGRQLAAALLSMDEQSYAMSWQPLRYEEGTGLGWEFIARNVGELRQRLLEGYANAAL